MVTSANPLSDEARTVYKRIGNTEWQMEETRLDVVNDVSLWPENPRLKAVLTGGTPSEIEQEESLRGSPGYDSLRASIEKIGQMEPIYVKETSTGQYITLEGNTRVAVFRELDRKHKSGKLEGHFRRIRAWIVPSNFSERDIRILLAGIHVGGPGVRGWGRYIDAEFVYETVVGALGKPPVMNQAELAASVGKTESWVSRHKLAYQFAMKFVEHVDGDENPRKLAADNYSTLEEISKARIIGSHLREYENNAYDELRAEVFDMVQNDVFKEYRDARFLKDFHDDPDLWDQLKSGEKHIANKLATQIHNKNNSPKAKIAELPKLVKRTLDREDTGFDDEDIASLKQAIEIIEDQVHDGVNTFRLELKKATDTLNKVSRADALQLHHHDIKEIRSAYEWFDSVVTRHFPSGE